MFDQWIKKSLVQPRKSLSFLLKVDHNIQEIDSDGVRFEKFSNGEGIMTGLMRVMHIEQRRAQFTILLTLWLTNYTNGSWNLNSTLVEMWMLNSYLVERVNIRITRFYAWIIGE